MHIVDHKNQTGLKTVLFTQWGYKHKEKASNTDNVHVRMKMCVLTSKSHGRSFRSNKISNPNISKQTLSLPRGAPGRHMR